ncbi:MAG: hypothetical protein MRJ93_14050 [Nitrososphaeraceae archaeon]|nr:hypothetical protein [Nitrososphaeraceae archaeon]
MKTKRDKKEYKRASTFKQKMEGMSCRTIAKNLGVHYSNVFIGLIITENIILMA